MRAVLAIGTTALALLAAGAAHAQQAAPAAAITATPRVSGEVAAASATSVSVRAADGKVVTVAVVPDVVVAATRTISADDIKTGDFVASGNATIGENVGRANELRVMAPGVRIGEGNRAMPQPNMMMTHGDVVAIKNGEQGRDLLVRFPGGERHVVVPPGVRVTGQTRLGMADLKPGMQVTVILSADKPAPTTSYIMISQPRPAAQ